MLRRGCLPLFQLCACNAAPALLLHIRQCRRFFLFARQITQHSALNAFPALIQHHLAFCRKFFPGADRGQNVFCIAVRLSHGTEQPCRNQPQNAHFSSGQGGQVCFYHTCRRQQRVVVRDLASVDYLLHMNQKFFFCAKNRSRSGCKARQ